METVFISIGDYVSLNGILYQVVEIMPDGAVVRGAGGEEKFIDCSEIQYTIDKEVRINDTTL